jgi:hypothetical protein
MGMITFILAIVAILLAGFVFFSDLAESEVDLTRCDVVYTALNDPKTTSCDEVCGSQRQCIVAYEKNRASKENSPLIQTQDSLIECNQQINVGILEENEGPDEPNTIHRNSLDCVCCEK